MHLLPLPTLQIMRDSSGDPYQVLWEDASVGERLSYKEAKDCFDERARERAEARVGSGWRRVETLRGRMDRLYVGRGKV